MTTYSGEDGMAGTDQPDLPGLLGEGAPDASAAAVSEQPPAYDYPYPEDEHSYNATDVLPAPLPGGRRARRQAEEEARAAAGPTGAKAVMTGTPSGPGRVIVPVALALVSAVALAAAWLHLESDRADSSAQRPAPVVTPSQQPLASGSPSPSASTAPSTSSSASAKPSTSTAPSASSSAAPSATTSAKPAGTVDRSVPVVVLNATTRPGLAAKVASQLRADGWKVTSVGNWTKGGVDTTTIFLNGHVAARDTMIKDLPAADGRVELPLAGMPKLRLVVVVGDDYKG